MSANDFVAPIISGLFSAGGAGAFVAYFKDRRVAKAKGTVAEQTVDIEIDTNRLVLVERQLQYLTASFNTERESLLKTITHLQADLATEQRESEAKDLKISNLTKQVDEIQRALDQVKAELAGTKLKPDTGS